MGLRRETGCCNGGGGRKEVWASGLEQRQVIHETVLPSLFRYDGATGSFVVVQSSKGPGGEWNRPDMTE